MILYWIIMTIHTSNSFSIIFIRILPEYFPIPLSHLNLKRSFHLKNQNLIKKSLSSILFVYWCRPLIFRSNTPFWQSGTALDGPLINQSNRLFLSGYTIKLYTKTGSQIGIDFVPEIISQYVKSRGYNVSVNQNVLLNNLQHHWL